MKNEKPIEVTLAVETLEEHKAEGIEVLDVSQFTPFCTHYVIATAQNPRALNADIDYLEETFEKNGIEVSVSEGNPESGWVIIQGGEVVCHIFLAANRKEIDLEALIGELGNKACKSKEQD